MQQSEKQTTKARLDGNYPGLNGLSYGIGYLEQLLAILSEPLLISCAALAVVDFITGGRLLQLPAIMYIWAGSLAIAVSACFIVTWRRAIRAFTLNYYGAAIGLCVMGIALGLVDWAAIDVQSLQQTLGVSFTNALAQLNLNIILITHLRSAVAIAMAVVVAISNHTAVTTAQRPARRLILVERILDRIAPVVEVTPPGGVTIQETDSPVPLQIIAPDLDEKLQKTREFLALHPEATDEALAQYLSITRAAAARFWRLQAEVQPTQPGEQKGNLANLNQIDDKDTGELPIYTGRFESKESAIRAALAKSPQASPEAIAQEAGCSVRTAQRWMDKIRSEQ
jgi:hypothetical protein